jgi:tetratricopeptide (TPR) repeat protein
MQCKKHLKRCDDIIPKMNSSFQILETLRSLANFMFILLVCVAAFLISIYIGLTLIGLTVIMTIILLVDLKKFKKDLNSDKTFKRAKEYLTKGKQFYNVNQNDKAKKEFEKIINLFDDDKNKYEILLAETHMFRGLISSNKGEFDNATEEYEEAIECIKNNDSNYCDILKSGIHYNMGTNYRRKAQNYENSEDKEIALNKALKSYEDSLELRKKREGDVSSSYRAIASIFKMKKDYNKALGNFDLAIEEYKKQNKEDWWIATTIESKGSLYLEKFINEGHNKFDFESAKKFFEESLQIREDLKANSPENVYLSEKLFSSNNLATLHRLNAEFLEKDDKTEAKEEFKKALKLYKESLKIEEKLDGDRDYFKGNLHYIIGITNIGLEEYKEAIICLRKSAELRKKLNKETKDCVDKIESIITKIEDNEIREWLKKFKTQK